MVHSSPAKNECHLRSIDRNRQNTSVATAGSRDVCAQRWKSDPTQRGFYLLHYAMTSCGNQRYETRTWQHTRTHTHTRTTHMHTRTHTYTHTHNCSACLHVTSPDVWACSRRPIHCLLQVRRPSCAFSSPQHNCNLSKVWLCQHRVVMFVINSQQPKSCVSHDAEPVGVGARNLQGGTCLFGVGFGFTPGVMSNNGVLQPVKSELLCLITCFSDPNCWVADFDTYVPRRRTR